MSEDLSRRLAQLSERFVERTAKDRSDLAAALRELGQSPELARAEMAGIAHRLAGIAGIFGFDAVGALASRLDDEARLPDADDRLLADLCSELVARLEDLAAQRD